HPHPHPLTHEHTKKHHRPPPRPTQRTARHPKPTHVRRIRHLPRRQNLRPRLQRRTIHQTHQRRSRTPRHPRRSTPLPRRQKLLPHQRRPVGKPRLAHQPHHRHHQRTTRPQTQEAQQAKPTHSNVVPRTAPTTPPDQQVS